MLVRTGWSKVFFETQKAMHSLVYSALIMPDDILAHKALNFQVNPSSQWHCHPGRPRNRWVNQIQNDNNLPCADLLEARCQSWSLRSYTMADVG